MSYCLSETIEKLLERNTRCWALAPANSHRSMRKELSASTSRRMHVRDLKTNQTSSIEIPRCLFRRTHGMYMVRLLFSRPRSVQMRHEEAEEEEERLSREKKLRAFQLAQVIRHSFRAD